MSVYPLPGAREGFGVYRNVQVAAISGCVELLLCGWMLMEVWPVTTCTA